MRLVLRSVGKPGPVAGTHPSADTHTAQQDRLLLLKEVLHLQSVLCSPQLWLSPQQRYQNVVLAKMSQCLMRTCMCMQAVSVVNRLGRPALSELLAEELARSWVDVARFKDSHKTWTDFMLPAVLHFLKGALDNFDNITGPPGGDKSQVEVRQLSLQSIFRMSSACRTNAANSRLQQYAVNSANEGSKVFLPEALIPQATCALFC